MVEIIGFGGHERFNKGINGSIGRLGVFRRVFSSPRASETGAVFGVGKTSPILIPEMGDIPGDTFEMGSTKLSDELPVRKVTISAFKLGLYEVTNAEYGAFLKATKQDIPKEMAKVADEAFSRHPVADVTWNNADAFCKWMSEKTERKFRLPTEAEWEYAARGSMGMEYPWGENEWDPSTATFNTSGTAPVDAHPGGKSWCGIYDLSGNVWEWVNDWYAQYNPKELIDPKGPKDGIYKVLRGGSWYNYFEGVLRGADRIKNRPEVHYDTGGFRVAEDIK
jgi:formylglycine-generating enzyme